MTGQPQNISMQLYIAKDQELDLYFLTDISTSMQDDIATIKELGQKIDANMENVTKK